MVEVLFRAHPQLQSIRCNASIQYSAQHIPKRFVPVGLRFALVRDQILFRDDLKTTFATGPTGRKFHSRFKAAHSLEARRQLSDKLCKASPDCIPLVIEKVDGSFVDDISCIATVGNPSVTTVRDLSYAIRRKAMMEPETALFLVAGGRVPPDVTTLHDLHQKELDEDGFLYIMYMRENTFDIGVFISGRNASSPHLPSSLSPGAAWLQSPRLSLSDKHSRHRCRRVHRRDTSLSSEVSRAVASGIAESLLSSLPASRIDASFLHHMKPKGESSLLRREQIDTLGAFLTDEWARHGSCQLDFQIELSRADLVRILCVSHAEQIVRRLFDVFAEAVIAGEQQTEGSSPPTYPTRVVLRRVCAVGHFIDFHTDVAVRTMQIALNCDERDYHGGRLVYLQRRRGSAANNIDSSEGRGLRATTCDPRYALPGAEGPTSQRKRLECALVTPRRPPGSYTIHGSHIVHGVTVLERGVRMALFLLRDERTE